MTAKKHLKRRVRLRAARTGEPYATALRKTRQQQENRMSASAASAEDFVASCSFCGKPHTSVQKLVAGPGVYICNECVDLSAAVIADAALTTPEQPAGPRSPHADPSPEQLLELLPALVRSADRVESGLARSVSLLRERGTDWQTIADAAGVSIDRARERFEAGPGE